MPRWRWVSGWVRSTAVRRVTVCGMAALCMEQLGFARNPVFAQPRPPAAANPSATSSSAASSSAAVSSAAVAPVQAIVDGQDAAIPTDPADVSPVLAPGPVLAPADQGTDLFTPSADDGRDALPLTLPGNEGGQAGAVMADPSASSHHHGAAATSAPAASSPAAALPAGSGALDSATVQRIVERLVALHFLASASDAQSADTLAQAIRDFQTSTGISPSGTLDRDTIGRLTTP